MRRILLVLLTLVLGVAGGMALAVAADVRTFPGVDARRTAAEPEATATVTATATATTTVTATPTPTESASPTSSASASPSTAPTPTATASSQAPAPTDGRVALNVTKEGSYVVRSGPVTCYLLNYFGDRWAECTVRKQQFAEPKRPASCEYDWAPQFTLKAKATYGACRSDANDVDSTTRLKAGERAVDGPITCVATTDGIDCRNTTSGSGFTVSRATYRLF